MRQCGVTWEDSPGPQAVGIRGLAKILIPKTIQRILGKFGFKGVGGEEIPVSRRVLLFYELPGSEWRDGVGCQQKA